MSSQPSIASNRAERTRPIFGIRFSPVTTDDLVRALTGPPIPEREGPRVIVTANLDHIVQLSRNEAFRASYDRAWVVTADGMPVLLYAKLKRADLAVRVTGADLFAALLPALSPERHRCFFVAGAPETADRLADYLVSRGFERDAIAIEVPPFRFEEDVAFSAELAERIRAHHTSHLFVGVGAPKSEVWTDRYRDQLGDCYVLNCGAALDFFAGTKQRAPVVMRRAGMEWLWRFGQEPQRLYRRYFVQSWLFLGEVAKDLASSYR